MSTTTRPREILTTTEMARADRLAVEAGVPSLTLMENAGRAVADQAQRMVQPGVVISVVCGPGNNGGDGFVAARLLLLRGFIVRLLCLVPVGSLTGDAAVMAKRWTAVASAANPASASAAIDGAALVIDAMFGAGLSRPLDGAAAATVEVIRGSGLPVLAVDVPSGLDGNTGAAVGPVLQATATVTFFRHKPGHLLLPGRRLCARVILADIGIPDRVLTAIQPSTMVNTGCRETLVDLLQPSAVHHKYQRGHAVVVSGPAERTGAARLAARGALRVGAGLVTVASPRAAFPVNAAHLTAIMLEPFTVPDGLAGVLADERRNAVLIGPGCGVGENTCRMVEIACAGRAGLVLDADAMTSFEAEPARLWRLLARRREPRGGPRGTVLTPHDGEFKRLFGAPAGCRLEHARAAAATAGCVVVLKGPDTVIAAPDGRAAINDNAPAWLATAGSGDVLAGFVTGLMAVGLTDFEAACCGVWLHGACAARFGPGLIAEDLPDLLPQVLADFLLVG